jgi:hypothetical protein
VCLNFILSINHLTKHHRGTLELSQALKQAKSESALQEVTIRISYFWISLPCCCRSLCAGYDELWIVQIDAVLS